MPFWSRIRRTFAPRRQPMPVRRGLRKEVRGEEPGPFVSRRFNAAQFSHQNRERWPLARTQSINNDLAFDLQQLMARCDHEYANNPIFEGIVNTFKNDVVGPGGPTLQINSDDPEFNAEVERQWRAIFARPNPARRTSGGVEVMKQWVHMLMTAGSYLNTFIEPRRDNAVSFGWKTMHPRRLVTPDRFAGDPNVAFGQRINDDGEVVEYYIDKPLRVGQHLTSGVDYQTLPAAQVQHRYIEVEPEQLTGYPRLASTLETAADIRQVDRSELKAQRLNALHAVTLQSADPAKVVDPDPLPDATYPISDDETEATVIPSGWAAAAINANRPSANHIQYRRERIAEMGLPVGMPLLVILLTVDAANFSSAQFGQMLYEKSIKNYQSFIQRTTLDELLEMLITQLVLAGVVRKPASYTKSWTHNVPPSANLEKYVKAVRMMIEDRIISRSMAITMFGFDPDEVYKSCQRDSELSAEFDQPEPAANRGSGPQEPAATTDDAEEAVEDAHATVDA